MYIHKYIYIYSKNILSFCCCVCFFPLRSSSTLSKPFRHASGPASLGPESPGLNSRLGEYESWADLFHLCQPRATSLYTVMKQPKMLQMNTKWSKQKKNNTYICSCRGVAFGRVPLLHTKPHKRLFIACFDGDSIHVNWDRSIDR